VSWAEVPPQTTGGNAASGLGCSQSSAPRHECPGTGDGFARPLTLGHKRIEVPPGSALTGTTQGIGKKGSGLWLTAHPAVVAAWDGNPHTLSRIGYRLRRLHAIASRGLGFILVSCQYSSDWRRAMEAAPGFSDRGPSRLCRTRNIPHCNMIQFGIANFAGRVHFTSRLERICMSEDDTPPELDPLPVRLDPDEPTWEQKRQWIADCTICDPDGYRANGTQCNHNPDQEEINRRGIARCRAALPDKPRAPQYVPAYTAYELAQRQREAGPPQPLSDEQEPEL
jgi:hypothetical protein